MSKNLPRSLQDAYRGWDPADCVARFGGWLDRSRRADGEGGDYDHTVTVNDYYNLCSEFMQFGWSESLHFAPLTRGETLEESIARHQGTMIDSLELREGMQVVDVGCGVGGPMRQVIRASGATVVGINNNERQLEMAGRRNVEAGLDHMAEYVKCNFMDMSAIEADSFDAGYAIESTCHAPDKERVFAEIFRVLKPGAPFWGQEMCMTESFDPDNARHRAIKDELMLGVALPQIATFREVDDALKAAGFHIVEAADRDLGDRGGTPWYRPMEGQDGILRNAFRRLPWGRKAMIAGLWLAEAFRVFPKGSSSVVKMMDRTADAFVAGGRNGLFTPLYCFLARKPG